MKDEKKATYQKNAEQINAEKSGIIVYDLPEVCGILNISRQTAMRYIKNGILPCHKVGGRWLIQKSELEAFIQGK